MSSAAVFLKGIPSLIWHQIGVQQNGIAFLTLVPFAISSVAMIGWVTDARGAAPDTPQTYTLWAALFLVLLSSLALIRCRHLLCVPAVISALILTVMAFKATPWRDDNAWVTPQALSLIPSYDLLYVAYAASVVLTLAAIVTRPTVSHWGFRLSAAVVLLDVLSFTFRTARSLIDPIFTAYYPSLISVTFTLLAIVLLRMVAKFVQENRETQRALGQVDPQLKSAMWRQSFSLWWPMLMIFVLFGLFYAWADHRYVKTPLITTLNTYEFNKEVSVYDDGIAIDRNERARRHTTVENAAKGALAHYIAAQKRAIAQRIEEEIDAADDNTDKVMAEAEKVFPTRFPGTKTRRCRFLDFACYISNGVKSSINSGYISARNEFLADLRADLDAYDGAAEDFGNDAKDRILDDLTQLGDTTEARITEVALALRFFGWVMLLYSLVILAKSLMIVFARVYYSRLATTPAFSGKQDQAKSGKMTKVGAQVALTADGGYDRYYVSFRTCGNNVVDRRRIPQPFKLVLRRLFAHNYSMCLIDFPADPTIKSCDLIVDPPAQIVQWDLVQGDEIFVDMNNVIGFSAGCTLERHISLSLGALIFGRAIYYAISGPGRVYIRTSSAPLAAADPGTENVMQGSSLIAWRRDTQFHIKSALTLSDTFLSGYSLQKVGKRRHLVIYDTSQSRRVGTGGGILRMARAFLLPF